MENTPLINQEGKTFNDKKLLILWRQFGTQGALKMYLKDHGYTTHLGTPVYEMEIGRRIRFWVINHKDEARQYYMYFSDDQWDTYIVRTACFLYHNSRKLFIQWVSRNKWAADKKFMPLWRFTLSEHELKQL